MKKSTLLGGLCLLGAVNAQVFATDYHPIDFSAGANGTFSSPGTINGGTYLTGSQNFAGVPFEIPTTGNNVWYATLAPGSNPRILNVPVGLAGVTDVWTLINTYWGEQTPLVYASVEFIGSDTGYAKFDLDGNDDIRDYNFNPAFAGTVNGVTAVEVFDNGKGQRLDRQHFALPLDFADETLSTIRFSDIGDENFQRIFVGGITAATNSVPDGGSTLLLLSCSSLLLFCRGRRQ